MIPRNPRIWAGIAALAIIAYLFLLFACWLAGVVS